MSLCKLQSKLKKFTWISHWKLIKSTRMIMIKNLCNKDGQFFFLNYRRIYQYPGEGTCKWNLRILHWYRFLSVPQLKRFVNNKKWATNNVKIEYGLSFDIKYLGFKIEASNTASGVPLRIPFGQCFSTWFISDRVNKVSF